MKVKLFAMRYLLQARLAATNALYELCTQRAKFQVKQKKEKVGTCMGQQPIHLRNHIMAFLHASLLRLILPS